MRLESLSDISSVFKVGSSLFSVKRPEGEFRKYLKQSVLEKEILFNDPEAIHFEFERIKLENKLETDLNSLYKTYWDKNLRYKTSDILITAIQFFDDHKESLPATALPPEKDIKTYIEKVLSNKGALTVSEQFKILLDITDNHLSGAGNLGMMASRIMARRADTRAYPGIQIDQEMIGGWKSKVASFETHSEIKDNIGDTYYFWTSFWLSTLFGGGSGVLNRIFLKNSDNLSEIMAVARKSFAKQPVIGSHYQASLLGKEIGLALISDAY